MKVQEYWWNWNGMDAEKQEPQDERRWWIQFDNADADADALIR